MTPFFFGDSSSPLWGVVDEPPAAVERGHGVLICPPIGHEYVRCHWALRQVASTLAKQGHHVLRFDWHGVGDSSGSMFQATVARWCEDVHTASRELLDSTGVSSMSIVAVRLGAALAARAAKKVKARAFVVWDPVVDGASYINSLKRLHAKMLVDDKRFWTLGIGKVRLPLRVNSWG
ncbi:MAG: alpha/beta hydrolase [Polyangiaceae bacterium]|nr:alpha/beta hydrolase [Polyangiaceae bacterium]